MLKEMIKSQSIATCAIVLILLGGSSQAGISNDNEVVGTIFGDPVSRDNYFIIMKTVLTHHSPWGGIPREREQLQKRVWDELLLSYEAHRRNITVEQQEIEEKIKKTLKDRRVSFDRKSDMQAYEQWLKESLKTSVHGFENQMRHLVQIGKLHNQVLNSVNISVTEKEIKMKFLDQQNTLSVEVAEFEELTSANEFYEQVKSNPDYWEEASKNDKAYPPEDRSFRKPGMVALEFLIDVWKFPREAVYAMIEMTPGDYYVPQPIHKGYGVFKIREIRRADEANFAGREEYYADQLRTRKKYDGFEVWLDDLRKKADIQSYIDPPSELFR